MFDIGFSELFLVALVALVVLGPERLPKAARFAGLWIRRARSQWQSVKSELENELADEELKSSLRETRDQLHGVRRQLQEHGDSLRSGLALDPDRVDDRNPNRNALDAAPDAGSTSDSGPKTALVDRELDQEPDPDLDPELDPEFDYDSGIDLDPELRPDYEPAAMRPEPGEPGPDAPATESAAPNRHHPGPEPAPTQPPPDAGTPVNPGDNARPTPPKRRDHDRR